METLAKVRITSRSFERIVDRRLSPLASHATSAAGVTPQADPIAIFLCATHPSYPSQMLILPVRFTGFCPINPHVFPKESIIYNSRSQVQFRVMHIYDVYMTFKIGMMPPHDPPT